MYFFASASDHYEALQGHPTGHPERSKWNRREAIWRGCHRLGLTLRPSAKESSTNSPSDWDWETSDVCRLVGRPETKRDGSDIQPSVEELEADLRGWRSVVS